MQELVFLKLGGSLITDKAKPYTVRLDKLADLSKQIAHALQTRPTLRLVLGHGSGSFGHTAAKEYRTKSDIRLRSSKSSKPVDDIYWKGFAEVWYQASTLNRYVIQALHDAGLPVMSFSPVASVWTKDSHIAHWDLSQIRHALAKGIIPVIHGDVIFDRTRGGTILSTEALFEHMAREMTPERILLAGLEAGVWTDFPVRGNKVEILTRESFNEISQGIGNAVGDDVTGGMQSKVEQMLTLVNLVPGLKIQIFSGEDDGNLEKVLLGAQLGTLITP